MKAKASQNSRWKDVVGFEGVYMISRSGKVKSLERDIQKTHSSGTKYIYPFKEMILKTTVSSSGYEQTSLYKDGKQNLLTIHRLLAKAFIPNPENKRTVNHKNGVKTDNRISNLEWATYSENIRHAYRTGLNKPSQTGKFGSLHNASRSVYKYSIDGEFIESYTSLTEASNDTSCDVGSITKVCQGKRNSSKGFKWSYTNLKN